MSGYSAFQKPFKITGPDGTVYYEGAGKFGVLIEAETDTNDGDGIEVGGAAIQDSATVVAGPYTPVTEYVEKLVVARVTAAASVGFIGVALNKFGIEGGKGILAGSGSIVGVRCTSAAIQVGEHIIGSATAGLVAKDATSDPATGTVLGECIKAAAQEGSSGNYFAGVYVNPS